VATGRTTSFSKTGAAGEGLSETGRHAVTDRDGGGQRTTNRDSDGDGIHNDVEAEPSVATPPDL
jgi:hypothetical protein